MMLVSPLKTVFGKLLACFLELQFHRSFIIFLVLNKSFCKKFSLFVLDFKLTSHLHLGEKRINTSLSLSQFQLLKSCLKIVNLIL